MTTEFQRVRIDGPAIAVRGNDIDTDRIIPARFLRCVTFDGIGEHAFEDDRAQLKAQGQTHPFDDVRFQSARILLVNKNFGCGSSREHAPQAIMRWGKGIRAIVGESFAEIFFGNCLAMGIPCLTVDAAAIERLMSAVESDPSAPVGVDVEALRVTAGTHTVAASLPDGARRAFLNGTWDTTAELLSGLDHVRKTARELAYFDHWGHAPDARL